MVYSMLTCNVEKSKAYGVTLSGGVIKKQHSQRPWQPLFISVWWFVCYYFFRWFWTIILQVRN